jgi:hypothetical protein
LWSQAGWLCADQPVQGVDQDGLSNVHAMAALHPGRMTVRLPGGEVKGIALAS